MQKEGIAIIGIGCRFPGGVDDINTFWKLLIDGREAVCEVPADRWNISRFYDAEPGIAGKSIAKRGGFVNGIDQFDPQFFGISPREAPYVDPQQRLLLETAWEAIEDAGIILDFEKGTDIAVYAGVSHNDYQVIQGTPWDSAGISPHSPTGTAHSIGANRISYSLNLRGPSVAMDTACSSALTAVHAACEHIWTGRGDMALAGGVTVMITPGGFIGFSQASMLSPDGHCKAFDASANGFVRGEGAGMVMLKRLSAAIADGDPIQGVILGTSLNQDGHTNGISLPSPEAQADLVRDACKDAGISPVQVGFVEAHGTGTAVGDPIEAHALAEALCEGRPADQPLAMGSVKTNLGHLETAAGIAGLVKAILVLKHGQIPKSLHFETPNPNIDFEALKLRIPTELEDFPETDGPRIAGVNSFGFGGANSHVIVAEAPHRTEPKLAPSPVGRYWPITLSARSEEALKSSAWRLSSWLEERANANGSSPILPDLVYTLGARRNHHAYRLTLTAASMAEVVEELNGFSTDQAGPKLKTSFSPRPEHAPRVGFVMSGQGPQWWGMGRELMANEPVFKAMMERCAAAMEPYATFSLLEELGRSETESKMSRTGIAQPAIFAMQMSLCALWESYGVKPTAIVGHSVGEIAAACLAGIMSVEEGARIIVLRGQFMDGCARGDGTMLAVSLSKEEAQAVIMRHDRTVMIAAFNGPRSLTLAGAKVSLEAIQAELEGKDVFARFVRVDHPFHHPLMNPAAEALEKALADFVPQEETVPFFSTVTGTRQAGVDCVASHWGCGVRQPVLFAPAVEAVAEFGVDVWLEISAHPALVMGIQETLAGLGIKAPVVSSARRDREHEAFLETTLDLHRASVSLDFKGMTPSRHQLSLPTYAWDKSRWWSESPDWKEGRLGNGGRGMLDVRLPRATPTWVARLDSRHMVYLKDHKVENMVIFPAAGFVEMILEAGAQYFEGQPFAIEDLEIRKPLILPESTAGLLLEVTYDPNERTFTIQSRFEQAVSWSVHVVGFMRSERVDSPFATSTWETSQQPDLETVEVTGFYDHMSDMGLRYGEEFRGVRKLAASNGKSSGRVALSEAIEPRAEEYQLHPVLLDGALHIFSAGAATVEDRKARLKLPVRFGKILFLRPPGASTQVQARVVDFADEFLEGALKLYDEAGKPCVLIDGFRAIAVSGVRRGGGSGGARDLVYNVDWERSDSEETTIPVQKPLPLAELQQAAHKALDEIIDMRGKAKLEAAMAAGDDLAAALITKGILDMGAEATKVIDGKALGVADAMLPAFGQLLDGLALRGLVTKDAAGYKPTAEFATVAASAQDVLRSNFNEHSGHLPESLLVSATGDELGPILRGEKDAVQVLFTGPNTELLDQFYGDGLFTSHWLAAIAAAVKAAALNLPEGRGLRILEVGAGTGGLASQILPQLERGLHSYTFTDISAGFFPAALQKLAEFPEVECKIYDLERPGTEQGFEAGSYDIIVGTNVIHAVSDVTKTLKNIHDLLVPGGSLIFMEVATPMLWTEAVFGLTSGWWSLTDRDLRPVQPLMERPLWEKVLKSAGFSETGSLPGLTGPRGTEGQVGLLARKEWDPTAVRTLPKKATETDESAEEVVSEAAAPVPAPTLADESWFIFADEGGLGDQFAARLLASGAQCRIARRGKPGTLSEKDTVSLRPEVAQDWHDLLKGWSESSLPDHLVYFWSLDDTVNDAAGKATDMSTDALLHLTQAKEIVLPVAKMRLDLITSGAQPVGREATVTAVAQAPAIGLLRVIRNEHPNFNCHAVDLPPVASAADVDALVAELAQLHGEREIAFRGDARYVQRLSRGLSPTEQWIAPGTPLRLQSRERGHLDTLRFVPFEAPTPAPNEVLIDVKAAGMNFRDVLKALALYPGEAPDARIFGDEVGGIITAVGSEVTHVAVGDRVYGLAMFGLSTQSLARGADVVKIPGTLSFEECATLPVVFMTAWHSLKNVARMRAGERILVHAGAGGVGMAAIQIAHHLGVEVIATAGNPTKRALLETMGVKHVIDSRRGDFAEAVMELTNRKGVHCVLNALASEAIPMGLSCLAEFGRFIEIGKRDIYQNSRIPLWPLRKNASFHVVAMDAVFGGDEELTRELLGEVNDLVADGKLHPLPFRAFPASRVESAFRLMAQGKHIGKVVVSFPEAFSPARGDAYAPPFVVNPEGTYLITGAFGGFGRVLANWLTECGARHLVLTSRSGLKTKGAPEYVKSLEAKGVEVQVIAGDAGVPEDVTRLISQIRKAGHPLKGVFHLAMVIDDAPLAALDKERMMSVVTPKAHGAWMLHEQTLDMKLDAFVMFSSISSVFGNPAQGNYAAANAFLDSLSHHRRALGLPATTVNWGVLGGEGYVARNEKVAEFLAKQGTGSITPGEVIALLESFISAGVAQTGAIRVDWAKWRQYFRGAAENPLLERIFASSVEGQESSGGASDWRAKIEAASDDERIGVIGQAVRDVVGSVLRVKPDSLREDQPLTDLGLDSLMGVEIENSLESAIGVALPPTSLMRARTIGQIATLIAEHMGATGGGAAAPAAPVAEAAVAATTDEVDIDALSDDDIAGLLGDDEDEDTAESTPSAKA